MNQLIDVLPAIAWMLGAALATYPIAAAAIRGPRLPRRKGGPR